MSYNVLILLLLTSSICTKSENALTYASNIGSTNVTHEQVVLHWQLPSNLTTVSFYAIVISNGNTTVKEITLNDSSVTSCEISNLDIWSTYTVHLTTFDLSGAIIGTDSYSFSTRFYFATPETLLATAGVILIAACYIAALVVRLACDAENDQGALQKLIPVEHEKRRRHKRERHERLKGGGYSRSFSRQFSNLLSWRRSELTDGEDSFSEKSYRSSHAVLYEHPKHETSSWRNTLISGNDTPSMKSDSPMNESDTPMNDSDTPTRYKRTNGTNDSVGTNAAPDNDAAVIVEHMCDSVDSTLCVNKYDTPMHTIDKQTMTEEALTNTCSVAHIMNGVSPVETINTEIDMNNWYIPDTMCDTHFKEGDTPATCTPV